METYADAGRTLTTTEGTVSADEPQKLELDEVAFRTFLQKLRDNQNLASGVAAGIGAATLCAALWAGVTAATHFQIGWMAIGVGFVVGHAVRQFGKGIDSKFGVTGAALSLLGCVAGNLLAVCIVISKTESMPLASVVAQLNPGIAFDLLKATFHPFDPVFYVLALHQGYRNAKRQITEEELSQFTRPA